MKKNAVKIVFAGTAFLFLSCFLGCKNGIDDTLPLDTGTSTDSGSGASSGSGSSDNSGQAQSGNSGNNQNQTGNYIINLTESNPTVGSNAAEAQDYIFNTDSVGITKITIRRSEWNKMLTYYDYFYKNENLVSAEAYEYSKDGTSWCLKNVGLRLRGNTSRFRPQGKDSTQDEQGNVKPNVQWNTDYYTYAANCSDNDYRQSHFKVDFEPGEDDDRKMSDCMKGVALKRCDSVFSREIFCYKLFHLYGIWTAPRASQTKVYINFVEDVDSDGTVKSDITGCSVTNVDYGVYEMFEEVNKQSLKGRTKDNNSASNAWTNNKGDLWKCAGGDLTTASNTSDRFGVEQVEILNTDKAKSEWEVVWKSPSYDLKTNKEDVTTATTNFQNFITELNALSSTNAGTSDGTTARKNFYEKWFDVDFFIKTYAVNMLVGMDDDYWGNANNYYLYFDNGKKGSGKCYLIPFDYDNTLGYSITGDKVCTDPMNWGNGIDRPLLDRLLEVPEYKTKFKQTLLEVSSQDSDSPWNKDKCFALWNKWKTQVSSYVSSSDINGHVGYTSWNDDGGWKSVRHYLTKEPNIYEQVTNNFNYWLGDSNSNKTITFDLNGGKINESDSAVVVSFTGNSMNYSDMISTPVNDAGYEFAGWTKTKDGTDFVYTYNYEQNLTLYAAWESQTKKIRSYTTFDKWVETTPGNWTNVGLKNNVNVTVDATTSEGLKIDLTHSNTDCKRVFMYVYNITNGSEKKLFMLDNIDNYDENTDASTPKTSFVYPYVTAGNEYKLKFEFNNKDWNEYHEFEITIKATGGKGDIYCLADIESFDVNTLKLKFTNPQLKLPDGVNNYPKGYLFTGSVWGDIINFGQWDYDGWNRVIVPVTTDGEYCQYQLNQTGGPVYYSLASVPSELYTDLRYEFTENGLTYLSEFFNGKIYPTIERQN